MNFLKRYILLNLLWYVVFFNLERLIAPVNLASFVYVLGAIYTFMVILLAPMQRISLVLLFLASLVPYLILKLAFQSPIAGMNLPLSVTEVVSIGITIYLARQIGLSLQELRNEVLRLSVGPSSANVYPFTTVQAECYREIRRARHYNRPVALLSIAPSKESVDLSINRFLLEAQNNIIQQYIVARTADLLRSDLKETDIVALHKDHFLVLLPETEQKNLDVIISRLQTSAYHRLGLSLNIGASSFPEEAITFESLVGNAEKRMKETKNIHWVESSKPVKVSDEKTAELQPRN